tara:strand:+ start:1204 stop:1485 length:282 start_codon:yes stop_codon:yes gene_type:complete
MNEEDINKIADRVANIVIDYLENKQEEWNNEFITQVENSKHDVFGNMRFATEQEILINELEKLEKLLANYLDAENYEKAAIINEKIKNLRKKL